ncbi:MAG: DNA repair protein RadC [Thiotrichales bacterium]|nr:DNA repair protein RadC [Thiotrichales bacterium]
MSIKHWPTAERPREKLLKQGAGQLSDAELLAIFLGSGLRGHSAIDLARSLLLEHGDLRSLLDAGQAALCRTKGVGPAKYGQMLAALELGKRYLAIRLQRGDPLNSPQLTRDFLRMQLRALEYEVFAVLFLDNRHRVIQFREMFRGSISGASVYPREVVKQALEINAAAVIFAHNHPSGVAEPSRADIQITQRLQQALELVEINVLDHFVIGDSEAISFAERGLL